MKNQECLLQLPSDLPDFEAAMRNLGRVPLVVHQALDHAASKTASHRDVECPGEILDAGLAATLMRFHAKRYLAGKDITAQMDEEEEGLEWSLDYLPFMGMSTANLLFLWDLNGAYGLSGLWLALPAVGGSRIEDVSSFWRHKIPHPAEGLTGITIPPTPPSDDLGGMFIPLSQDESQKQAK